MALLAYTAPMRRLAVVGVHRRSLALAVVAMVVNRVVLPTLTGWTLGRAVFGIRGHDADGAAAGRLRLLLRGLAHLLDTAALFVGWLWPLWDRRHRTFADLLLRTEVRVVDAAPKRDTRAASPACVLVAAALLCAAGGGLGYLQVYRHDRAVDQARTRDRRAGPAHRRADAELRHQTRGRRLRQGAVAGHRRLPAAADRPAAGRAEGGRHRQRVLGGEQRGAVAPTPDKAAMLLALQGQRGADPNEPEVHHRDGAGRLREVGRRAGGVPCKNLDGAEEAAD